MSQNGPRSGRPPGRFDTALVLIGAFKLRKGLLLVAVGIGALGLLHRDIAATLAPLMAHLHIDPEHRYLGRALTALLALDDRALKRSSAGTFFYAALLLIEGVGLLLRRRWAEHFTVLVTGSFIPLELYELTRRFTATRLESSASMWPSSGTWSITCADARRSANGRTLRPGTTDGLGSQAASFLPRTAAESHGLGAPLLHSNLTP